MELCKIQGLKANIVLMSGHFGVKAMATGRLTLQAKRGRKRRISLSDAGLTPREAQALRNAEHFRRVAEGGYQDPKFQRPLRHWLMLDEHLDEPL